jgi:hypothetical protein
VHHGLPRDVKGVLRKTLPNPDLGYKVVRREVGMASLGQQRFVAIANWKGGHIAREETLLYAMGSEAANVQLGSKRQVAAILKDLGRRKPNWLRSAARDMAKTMEGDWKRYRDS